MRRIITGYLVSYSDGDQVRQALFTDQPWHDPALESAIDRGTAQAVLLPEYSINSEIYFQPQGTESSVSLSDLSLDNTDARFDPWSRYIVSGMDIECRRGYFDQPWSEWDIRMRGKGRGRPEFIGREKMVIGVRDRFDWLRTPVAREVFGDDTPNTRLINTTVPLVFGEVFQASAPMIDPNIQAYFLAGNLGRINAAAEGGNPKALFERHGNIGQLLQQPLLKVTWNFGGPPSGVEGIVDLLEDVGSFDNWTAGQPDGFTVIEQTAGVTVTEEALGDEGTGLGLVIASSGDVSTGLEAPRQSAFIASGGGWSVNGADTHVEAVELDDAAFVRGAPGGFPIRTATLKFYDFDWPAVPSDAVITDIELRVQAETDPGDTDTSFWGGPDRAISMRLADNTFLREKLRNVNLPATKTELVLEDWGIDLTPDQANDEGFGFSFAVSRNEGESARGRIYQVAAQLHYTTGELDEYRLEREIALVPGTRYRIRITGMQDGESATVDFGGIETTGDPIPAPQDDFSSNTINVEGFTAAEATFIPRGSILVLRFRKGVGTTGKQIFSQIEILADSPVIDRLHPLTRYTAELYGEDPDEVVDNAAVEVVQNLAGNPPLGWYVRRETTGEELLRLLFRSCGSEFFTSPKGVISAAQMRPPQKPDGDYLAFDGKRFADLGTSEPDTGPNLTDRVHAARNVDPIVEDRTAEITTTWTEADRQMVVTDWRITERARFDDLQGFEPIVPVSLTLTSIDPSTGSVDGGTNITATGTGFSAFDSGAGDSWTIGGNPVTDITVVSDTEITGKTPASDGGATGSVDVTIAVGADSDTLVGGFGYTSEAIVKLTGDGDWEVPAGVENLTDVLIVAGGGGGGARQGGGGGAGGVLHLTDVAVTPGALIAYSVGNGGAGGTDGGRGSNGADSAFGANTAVGGGGGGGRTTGNTGADGGSGGGGASINQAGGTGTAGQGNQGGQSSSSVANKGGGGGGATQVGQDGSGSETTGSPGDGGDGLDASAIFGAGHGEGGWFGGGGGGGEFGSGNTGLGGQGGGGNGGSDSSLDHEDGQPETGGGGGGARGAAGPAGVGGSGVILIRYIES